MKKSVTRSRCSACYNDCFADRAYISNLHLSLCIRSSNAEKLMVLRCYDHNLNTDRKRRLWIWSGLFSEAFYENAAVSILRTAITWTRPTLHLCHKQSRLYFSSGIPDPPKMIAGLRSRRCSWRVCAAIACHNNKHNCNVCFFRFPNENYGDRYVLIVSSCTHPWNLCITKADEPMFCPKSYLSLTHRR